LRQLRQLSQLFPFSDGAAGQPTALLPPDQENKDR
jgi:hypothetical protein